MGRMCIACRDCGNVYGKWRPRCPTCGTVNSEPTQEGLETMTREEQMGLKGRVRRPKPPKEKKIRVVKRPCSMCGAGGAKNLCLVCGKSMHKHCLSIHERKCKFEPESKPITCDDVGQEHEWHEQPGEPPYDVCFRCGARTE